VPYLRDESTDSLATLSDSSTVTFGVTFRIPAGVSVSSATLDVYRGAGPGPATPAATRSTAASPVASSTDTTVSDGLHFAIDPQHPDAGQAIGPGTASVWIVVNETYPNCRGAGSLSDQLMARLTTIQYTST